MTIAYGFDSYYDDIQSLAYSIRSSQKKYDYLVGVVRGGCIPGVHLSNLLNVPFVPLTWSHTRNEKDKNHSILLDKTKQCLVVDDILDAGTTIYEIKQHYGDVDTAVLIYNCVNGYSLVPTYTAWTINRENTTDWIDFWWEK